MKIGINPITLNHLNPDQSMMMYIFGAIAILPTLIYVAFKKPRDDGSGGGLIGYYLIKLLRLFK